MERKAIITGSDSGMGKATAVVLAELGFDVGITWHEDDEGAPMTDAEDMDPGELDRPAIPLSRPGNAHEIARSIAFLVSEDASYVTGESFVVDGGLMMMGAMANQLVASR